MKNNDNYTQQPVLSVTELNRRARQLLETHLPLIWVEGEISNLARPSSGHWYFTLKDAHAQVRCAMFRNRNNRVKTPPKDGQQIRLRARVSLYEGRGDYQLIAEHMEDAGLGALQLAFEQLKNQLANEGLFSPEHKLTLPKLPRHIGIITSATGAAVRDVLTVLKRRFAGIPVSIFPVAVQGKEAPGQIVRALELAATKSDVDVIVLTRGGGSLEDLWAFNDEAVARSIFSANKPVVSAVGHEIDFTIADYVADLRAPTPSAAAELITPDGQEWFETFYGFDILLQQGIKRRLSQNRQELSHLRNRLQHPGQRLQAQAQHLDHLELRLKQQMFFTLERSRNQLQQLSNRQQQWQPLEQMQYLKQQLQQHVKRLIHGMQTQLRTHQQQLSSCTQLLDAVSPLHTLQRGYAIIRDESKSVIRKASSVKPGDKITATLAEGELECRVEESRLL